MEEIKTLTEVNSEEVDALINNKLDMVPFNSNGDNKTYFEEY